MNDTQNLHPESAVKRRYSAAAQAQEPALCCPIEYNHDLLKLIPVEVIEKDYGCGDPSRYLKPGETVLDLGSGTGKICFIAAQIVGATGRVIGVDMTDEMLDVARRNAPVIAERLGYANVEFRKGRIQDLALDLDKFNAELKKRPITDVAAFLAAEQLAEELRVTQPLIAPDSIDVVVSNCVLNLVEPRAKRQLFDEIFRVLRKGGRTVISDIVSDEGVPAHLKASPELWSGCVSGAFTEEEFLNAFADAGFYGIQILKHDEKPWRTVEGIEFRSVTVQAFKGKQGPCFDHNQAVIYLGPFKEVLDDTDIAWNVAAATPSATRPFSFTARNRTSTTSPLFNPSMKSFPPRQSLSPADQCACVIQRKRKAGTTTPPPAQASAAMVRLPKAPLAVSKLDTASH